MLTMEDLMPRVERGAAWLDKAKPGWDGLVSLTALRMEHCTTCVLGQCFGKYDEAPNIVSRFRFSFAGSFEYVLQHNVEWANAHGFFVGASIRSGHSGEWTALRECWVTVILSRRFAATVPSADATPASDAVDVLVVQR